MKKPVRRVRRPTRRMLILGGIAFTYMMVLIFFGSPLLALTTWLGLVDPTP